MQRGRLARCRPTSPPPSSPIPTPRESEKILRACVHCGFCTATCPTYVLLGDELDSPRGRIYLIKDMLENDRPATREVVKHIDRCLSCLVLHDDLPVGRELHASRRPRARRHIEETYAPAAGPTGCCARLLGLVLPRPTLFRCGAARRAGWRSRSRACCRRGLRALLALAPGARCPRASPLDRPQVFAAPGARRRRVALLTGCAQQVLAPEINEATVRLLDPPRLRGRGRRGARLLRRAHPSSRAGRRMPRARANIAGLEPRDRRRRARRDRHQRVGLRHDGQGLRLHVPRRPGLARARPRRVSALDARHHAS